MTTFLTTLIINAWQVQCSLLRNHQQRAAQFIDWHSKGLVPIANFQAAQVTTFNFRVPCKTIFEYIINNRTNHEGKTLGGGGYFK